ncbi:MAG: ATP-binding protein, partial [Woeseiaceae bacterium]|nr:ATP-binding protein [Woeseiaceae bacterium]
MFDAAWLSDRLRHLEERIPAATRYLVAFSGGVDSTALLHALATAVPAGSILALHVDHGLDPRS